MTCNGDKRLATKVRHELPMEDGRVGDVVYTVVSRSWPDSVASWRLGAGSGGALTLLGVASTATRRA
jgi:hypothetical protein